MDFSKGKNSTFEINTLFLANHAKSDPIQNQLIFQVHYMNKLNHVDVLKRFKFNYTTSMTSYANASYIL